MQIERFETEHFFAKYEFSSRYLLSNSDCESLSVSELLTLGEMSLSDLGEVTLGYTESRGRPELLDAIAATYENIEATDIIELNSPIEGIFVSMSALLEPQDQVVVLSPCYDALWQTPTFISNNTKPWWLKPVQDGWKIDFDALESLLEPPTKLLVVNFPHNPTGYLPTQPEFTDIINRCKERGVWLLSDEMYRGLELKDDQQLPSAASNYERSIVLSGLSKAQGLPGLRTGWLVVRDSQLNQDILNWKFYTSICSPAPSEQLALAALRAKNVLEQRNVEKINRNIGIAELFFARWKELFNWRAPRAGSVGLAEIHVPSATAFCHRLAKEAGIVLLPSKFFRFGDNHVRFGLGRNDFPDAIKGFEEYLLNQKTL